MGVLGRTEKEAALTSMNEYRLLVEGYEKKQRTLWEIARWEQFQQMLLSPNIKPFNKPRNCHAFAPFPWDEPEPEVKAEDIKVTDEEKAMFQLIVEDLKRRRNDIS